MKISVIIPVYNTENYIKKCIDSVLAQTYSDLEIIVIDDGSTDGSLNICRKMEKNDSRVIVFHQENSGVSSARNKGLEMASGEWVSFLDSDDYLDEDFYETLIDAVDMNAPIICCGVRPVNENGEVVPHLQYTDIPSKPIMLSGEEMWKHFLHPSKRYLYWSPWDKLIKASLAKKIRFVVGRKIGEDLFYCYQCLKEAGSIYYIPEKKYNYLIRAGSATHSITFKNSSFDSLYFSNCILSDGKNVHYLEYYARLNLLVVASRIVRGYCTQSKEAQQYDSEIRTIRQIIRKNLKRYCVHELRLKHLCLIFEAAFMPALFYIR